MSRRTAEIPVSERHRIYKEALKILLSGKEEFICMALYEAGGKSYVRRCLQTIRLFPEVMAQRPFCTSVSGAWWPIDDQGTKNRLKCLRRAIRLSKPTKK